MARLCAPSLFVLHLCSWLPGASAASGAWQPAQDPGECLPETLLYAPIGLCVPCGSDGELCCGQGSCSGAALVCDVAADPFVPLATDAYGLARVCVSGSDVSDQTGDTDTRRALKSSGAMLWRDSPAPSLDAAALWPHELDTLFGMSMFFLEAQRAGRLQIGRAHV